MTVYCIIQNMVVIEYVSTNKYLGVTIQFKIWNGKTTLMLPAIKQTERLGSLGAISKQKHKQTKEKAYKFLVQPILEYALPVWDLYQNEEVQLIAIRHIAAR